MLEKRKLQIAFLLPKWSLGGGYRKYFVYQKYLNSTSYAHAILIALVSRGRKRCEEQGGVWHIDSTQLKQFLEEQRIQVLYCGEAPVEKKQVLNAGEQMLIVQHVNLFPRRALPSAHLYFTVSMTLYYRIQCSKNEILPQTKVIYNPVDVKKWTHWAGRLEKKKKNLPGADFSKNQIIIGRIARTEPSKWDFLILQTICRLAKCKDSRCRFIFAGMPALHRWYLKIILPAGYLQRIIFLPELITDDQIAAFYSSIDLFWQASDAGETFGNSMAEAYCFAKPVLCDCKHFYNRQGKFISSRDNSQIEMVDDYQTGRILYYPSSIAAWLQAVSKRELAEMGKQGLRKVQERYDAPIACNTLCKYLYEALRKRTIDEENATMEAISAFPSAEECQRFSETQYWPRYESALAANRLHPNEVRSYERKLGLWHLIEVGYLLIRKCLRVFQVDLEEWQKTK